MNQKVKIVAMYLPQFHRVKENDEWWGEGFTEWVAVKNAKSYLEGHNQPRVPQNQFYYDLLERKTMEWQADLMHQYLIDGMCFYHYWFKDGKRILEKPAERLLQWKEIDMPFCFCWANESWSRTWAKAKSDNVWSTIYEKKQQPGESGILLEQDYGQEQEWEEHFQYLLPFFQDSRYIRIDGKPIFSIYKPNDSIIIFRMLRYWNKRAKDYGMAGIYFIGMENCCIGTDAVCKRQPYHAITSYIESHKMSYDQIRLYPYDEIWERILAQADLNKDEILCAFVDFDNTPRMGENGQVMLDANPEMFHRYFQILYQKSMDNNSKILFINAWNEWGEGMYLEPDGRNHTGYLEAVRDTVLHHEHAECVDVVDKSIELVVKREEMLKKQLFELNRHDKLLEKWLSLKERRVYFDSYFIKHGYKNIAIYGMGKLGNHLLNELKESEINIVYGIDRSNKTNSAVHIYNPEQELPRVDAVVITITDQYAEISRMLDRKLDCDMVPIEEVIDGLQ